MEGAKAKEVLASFWVAHQKTSQTLMQRVGGPSVVAEMLGSALVTVSGRPEGFRKGPHYEHDVKT
jgi:hypothetical protein